MLTFEQKLDRFEEYVNVANRRNKRVFRYTDSELFALANTLLGCADGWDLSVEAKELVDGLRARLKDRKAVQRARNESKRQAKKLAKRQKSFTLD